MNKELPKVYEPHEVEGRVYQAWEDNGCFRGVRDPDKKPFTIVMPPPNVTGQLHIGHAMDDAMQDMLIRYKRMQGYAALYLPGTDHAGIATQIKVEEELREKEGLTRHDLGREKFLERVWDWKHKYGSRIVEQQKKLGVSCDWERSRFTMDEGLSKAVRHVFVSLYDKGLIYKGSRIVNWCPHCVTALSDAEVEYQDKPGNLWHLKYPIVGEPGRYVIVATTRPETMLGDTGVAVHPDDERYKDLVGKKVLMIFFIIMLLFDPGIVPEYMVIRSLNLMGSQWSVVVCQAVNVYYLIIMMRYFQEVPADLCDAARIDGAGHMRVLFSVIAPLSQAGIATLTMFYGVVRWNEYYRAGIYISSISKLPLQVILRKFVVDGDVTTLVGTQNLMDYNALAQLDYTALQYATIIVAIIPILLIYPLVLKFYTKDAMAGGVKG